MGTSPSQSPLELVTSHKKKKSSVVIPKLDFKLEKVALAGRPPVEEKELKTVTLTYHFEDLGVQQALK
jgi:hypothetical protein